MIAIYNLNSSSPEMSREGYFHWKLHVASFLEKNWTCLFGLHVKKRKTWLGTISGTMSHWSGVIFRSGLSTLKESGWWKLMKDLPPADLISSVPSSINRNVTAANKTDLVQKPAAQASTMIEPGRKRTRGVQSSIAKAIALKEKRSSLAGSKPPVAPPPPKRPRTESMRATTSSQSEDDVQKSPLTQLLQDYGGAIEDDAFLGDNVDACPVDDIVSRNSLPNVDELMSRLTSSGSPPSLQSTTPSGRRSPFSSKASSVLS